MPVTARAPSLRDSSATGREAVELCRLNQASTQERASSRGETDFFRRGYERSMTANSEREAVAFADDDTDAFLIHFGEALARHSGEQVLISTLTMSVPLLVATTSVRPSPLRSPTCKPKTASPALK